MIENYKTIRKELENWSESMTSKDELIIMSKADICDSEMLEEMKKDFEQATGKKVALTISAGAYIRVEELKNLLIERIPSIKLLEQKNTEEDAEGNLMPDVKNISEDITSGTTIYDLKTRHTDGKKCYIKNRDD
jgi:GTPase involved in cell partitioning and DNA repair